MAKGKRKNSNKRPKQVDRDFFGPPKAIDFRKGVDAQPPQIDFSTMRIDAGVPSLSKNDQDTAFTFAGAMPRGRNQFRRPRRGRGRGGM